ncbi:MAG TPA: hypothetical protein VLI07_18605 [Candidatus Binatus sp.]|nr:hypothetical protein [Candidatus Binatus sp.]
MALPGSITSYFPYLKPAAKKKGGIVPAIFGSQVDTPMSPVGQTNLGSIPGANYNMGNTGGAGAGYAAFNPGTDFNASMSEIQGDPIYQAAIQQMNANIGSGRTSLRDAIRQAVIKGGWDLTGRMSGDLAGYAGDVDPATRAAAAGNQLSTKAQLDLALKRGISNANAGLAARGMLRSGGTETSGQRLNEQYQVQSNTAMGDLVDAIRGGVSNFAGLQREQQSGLNSVMSEVASRLAQSKATAAYYAWLASQGGQSGGGETVAPPTSGMAYDYFAPLGNLTPQQLGTSGMSQASMGMMSPAQRAAFQGGTKSAAQIRADIARRNRWYG